MNRLSRLALLLPALVLASQCGYSTGGAFSSGPAQDRTPPDLASGQDAGPDPCLCESDEDCDDAVEPCLRFACLDCMCQTVPEDGADCLPANPCTSGGVCKGGQCVPQGTKACDDGNPCTSDWCSFDSGECQSAPVDEKTPCDDLDPCTMGTGCYGGACGGGKPATCDDQNPCTVDSCEPAYGCRHDPDEVVTIDDGNACTAGEACVDGAVVPGQPVSCSDSNPCTKDWCDSDSGCVHDPAEGACEDGNPCTSGDECLAGHCQPGVNLCNCEEDEDCQEEGQTDACLGPLACIKQHCAFVPAAAVTCQQPSSICLLSACDPQSGQCVESNAPDGTPCNDSSMCTLVDICVDGACVGGKPITCNDDDACTEDSCDPASGCVFEPQADCMASCGDGLCNAFETCTGCSSDCGSCLATCGNQKCETGETCAGCPADCGKCPSFCSNGKCEAGETCASCPQDCGACTVFCPDAVCDPEESCSTCPADCGPCPAVCPNADCEPGETCQSCPADCGTCKPVCPNGACDAGETCNTCPADCGQCPPTCPNAKCDAWETCSSCPADCGQCPPTCPNAKCEAGETCNTCPADCGACPAVCGDGQCNGTESTLSCHKDCAPEWNVKGALGFHGKAFDAKPSDCTTCHGAALDGGVLSCNTCHPSWKTNCTFCHGGKDNTTGAPPFGVDGESLTTQLQVGAHTAHVSITTAKNAYNCAMCHTTPTDALSTGHINGQAAVALNDCAKGTYAPAQGSCSNVYCHGNGKSATSGGAASWTGGKLTCQSCHANAGLSGAHAFHLGLGFSCSTCHSPTVNAAGAIIDKSKHVNCTKDISPNMGYVPATTTCATPGCHASRPW